MILTYSCAVEIRRADMPGKAYVRVGVSANEKEFLGSFFQKKERRFYVAWEQASIRSSALGFQQLAQAVEPFGGFVRRFAAAVFVGVEEHQHGFEAGFVQA